MRFPGSHAWPSTALVVLGALAVAAVLVAVSPIVHASIHADFCPASAPCTPPPPPPTTPPPTPTPVNAFISLDVTTGDVNTAITVNGSAFLPNQSTGLYWDQPNKVAGASNTDANGNFTTRVKPFATDAPGVHRLCATVLPNPCASFTLQPLAASPTPEPSPSPSPTPSPTESPSPSASPTPVAATISGFDVLTRPPFVILPIIAGIGIAIALGYWILSLLMRPKQQVLKSVAVAHLASRPDYTAGFGAAPAAAAAPAPAPSAWADVTPPPPTTPPPAEEPQLPETSAAPESQFPEPPAAPESQLPDLPAAPDEPPDLPEPGDY